MQKMNTDAVESLDFRALRMLSLLLEMRSVTKAGEALGISQPAASRVLAQLRRALGDPLLVRAQQGMTLTTSAEALQPMVREALAAVSAVFQKSAFTPGGAKMTVRVGTTDYGATAVLAPLSQQLATSAPGVTIEVAPWSARTLADLESGRLDLALYGESRLPENFHFRALFRDRYSCLVRSDHPLLSKLRGDGSLNPKAAALYPQVVLLYPDGDLLVGDDVLAHLGHPAKRIVMRTPYFTSAPLLLANTDNLILAPSRLAQNLAPLAPVVEVRLHADTEFGYRLIWHERSQRDSSIGWIRAQIYELFATRHRTADSASARSSRARNRQAY